MEIHFSLLAHPLFITVSLLVMYAGTSFAALSSSFYNYSCPKVHDIVAREVNNTVHKNQRMGALFLRMHFHDCFVQGCDASILLNDTSSFVGEKTAAPNNNSLSGYEFIDVVKSMVEESCQNVVSCADILALVARDSVVALGGPKWDVQLGRRDSTTAYFSIANSGVIPSPASNVSNLIARFGDQGLSLAEMVALSGAHTIGKSRCTSFKARLYNETNIDSKFAQNLKKGCPPTTSVDDNRVFDLDSRTPTLFDNSYYQNILKSKGLLHSDQVLLDGGNQRTAALVSDYRRLPNRFNHDFGAAMVKMGLIKPLTETQGEIRKVCYRVN